MKRCQTYLFAKDPAQADAAYAAASIQARETAGLLGIEPSVRTDPSDRDCGLWSGRSLQELERTDPDGLLALMSDPGFAPPAGESVPDGAGRIRRRSARTPKPDDITATAFFLSGEAGFITGQTIHVDGGASIGKAGF
nr:histidine phosphatase family protein [Azospirillum sp. 412522]